MTNVEILRQRVNDNPDHLIPVTIKGNYPLSDDELVILSTTGLIRFAGERMEEPFLWEDVDETVAEFIVEALDEA